MTELPLPANRSLFGVPISAATMQQAVDACEAAIRTRTRLLIGVVNAAKIVNMRKNPRLRDAVLTADVIFADGMSVVWASRIVGAPLPERIAGIDLMLEMFARADKHRYRIFCLGATQEILDASVARLQREFPNAIVAGAHHGYFKPDEEPALADEIAAARPDMLFVAMTSPKKEDFLAKYAERMGVPVCHGVGGSFDVYAGKVKRAPILWQRLGLEWLYRTLQEPRRLAGRYFVTNFQFVGLVLRELFHRTPNQPRANLPRATES